MSRYCGRRFCFKDAAIKMKGRPAIPTEEEEVERLEYCTDHNLCIKCENHTSWDDALCMYCDPDSK